MTDTGKHILDAASAVAILTSLVGWLPPIAAALGIAWYCVQFYDRFWGRQGKNDG